MERERSASTISSTIRRVVVVEIKLSKFLIQS